MKIYLTCPVRLANEKLKAEIEDYVKALESQGNTVYYPARDTKQDLSPFDICVANSNAIYDCDQVYVLYHRESLGSHFDLGVAFAFGKKLQLINVFQEDDNYSNKEFIKLMEQWHDRHTDLIRILD